MNNIKTISKYTFLEEFFPYYPKKNVSNLPKSYPLRVIYFIFTYLLFGYFTMTISYSLASLYLNKEGGEVMYFAIFAIVVSLTILIFYLAKMISTFFSTKDIKLYKSLPISQGDLFIGKLIGTILSFLDFYLFLLINMGVYFYFKGFSLPVAILAIINFISMITIPYAILSFLILCVMRFTNIGSHRKLFKNIGYLILFAVIGLIYYFSFSGRNPASMGEEAEVMDSVMLALSSISNIFFNAKLYGQSLSGGLGHMLIYTLILAAISLALVFMLYKISNKIYYDAVSDSNPRKASNKSKANHEFKESSQLKAIFKRDIKNLFSNIVFLSQAIMMIIIFGVMTITIGKEFINEIDLNQDYMTMSWIFLTGFAIGLLTWVNSGFAVNDLSRERSSFYLFQTLAIDPNKHFKARFLANFTVSAIFSLILSLILAFGLGFGIKLSLIFFIGQVLSIYLATDLGLYLGSKNINTNWKKPEELSKGGVRGMIYYFLSFIYAGILFAIYVLIMNISSNGHSLAMLLVLLIILATIIIFRKLAINSYKLGFYDI